MYSVFAAKSDVLDFYIEPEKVSLDINQSYVFNSYADFSTGSMVGYAATWTVDNSSLIDMSSCQDSYTYECKIKVKKGPGEATLTAITYFGDNIGQKTATAYIKITSKTYVKTQEEELADLETTENNKSNNDDGNNSVEYFIEPAEKSMSLGSSYEFVSYVDFPTGTIKIESSWEIENDEIAEINDCEGSSCFVYAGVTVGETYLIATNKDFGTAKSKIKVGAKLKNPFTDLLPDWADEAIIQLYSRGIIKGYEDMRFAPSDSVTRAQFVLLIYRLMEFTNRIDHNFTKNVNCNKFEDIQSDHYAYQPVCYFDSKGWLDIDSKNNNFFLPDAPLERNIAAYNILKSILEDLMKNDNLNKSDIKDLGQSFDDVLKNNEYYYEINAVNFYQVMTGQDDGSVFEPNSVLNRAEASVILWRIKELLKKYN